MVVGCNYTRSTHWLEVTEVSWVSVGCTLMTSSHDGCISLGEVGPGKSHFDMKLFSLASCFDAIELCVGKFDYYCRIVINHGFSGLT